MPDFRPGDVAFPCPLGAPGGRVSQGRKVYEAGEPVEAGIDASGVGSVFYFFQPDFGEAGDLFGALDSVFLFPAVGVFHIQPEAEGNFISKTAVLNDIEGKGCFFSGFKWGEGIAVVIESQGDMSCPGFIDVFEEEGVQMSFTPAESEEGKVQARCGESVPGEVSIVL